MKLLSWKMIGQVYEIGHWLVIPTQTYLPSSDDDAVPTLSGGLFGHVSSLGADVVPQKVNALPPLSLSPSPSPSPSPPALMRCCPYYVFSTCIAAFKSLNEMPEYPKDSAQD